MSAQDESNPVSTVLSNHRQASQPFSFGQVSLLVARSTAVRKTPSAQSMCLVLRVDPFRLTMLTLLQRSQEIGSFAILSMSPLHRLQTFATSFTAVVDPYVHRLQTALQTNSASPLLSAIVDGFLLVAVIGHKPSLPFTHDAVPLTLNRSASPAQSASPYVNAEPSGARFAASRLKNVDAQLCVSSLVLSNDQDTCQSATL